MIEEFFSNLKLKFSQQNSFNSGMKSAHIFNVIKVQSCIFALTRKLRKRLRKILYSCFVELTTAKVL